MPFFSNRLASATLIAAEAKSMLVTMQNSELVEKLMKLARGDIDLVRLAIRESARGATAADLERVVDYIVEHRASTRRPRRVSALV
jgi:hypothetical protein